MSNAPGNPGLNPNYPATRPLAPLPHPQRQRQQSVALPPQYQPVQQPHPSSISPQQWPQPWSASQAMQPQHGQAQHHTATASPSPALLPAATSPLAAYNPCSASPSALPSFTRPHVYVHDQPGEAPTQAQRDVFWRHDPRQKPIPAAEAVAPSACDEHAETAKRMVDERDALMAEAQRGVCISCGERLESREGDWRRSCACGLLKSPTNAQLGTGRWM